MDGCAGVQAASWGPVAALLAQRLRLGDPWGQRWNLSPLPAPVQAFVESFVRPGCTHVTVAALLGAVERSTLQGAGAKGVAQQLLERNSGKLWASDMLVSLGMRGGCS